MSAELDGNLKEVLVNRLNDISPEIQKARDAGEGKHRLINPKQGDQILSLTSSATGQSFVITATTELSRSAMPVLGLQGDEYGMRDVGETRRFVVPRGALERVLDIEIVNNHSIVRLDPAERPPVRAAEIAVDDSDHKLRDRLKAVLNDPEVHKEIERAKGGGINPKQGDKILSVTEEGVDVVVVGASTLTRSAMAGLGLTENIEYKYERLPGDKRKFTIPDEKFIEALEIQEHEIERRKKGFVNDLSMVQEGPIGSKDESWIARVDPGRKPGIGEVFPDSAIEESLKIVLNDKNVNAKMAIAKGDVVNANQGDKLDAAVVSADGKEVHVAGNEYFSRVALVGLGLSKEKYGQSRHVLVPKDELKTAIMAAAKEYKIKLPDAVKMGGWVGQVEHKDPAAVADERENAGGNAKIVEQMLQDEILKSIKVRFEAGPPGQEGTYFVDLGIIRREDFAKAAGVKRNEALAKDVDLPVHVNPDTRRRELQIGQERLETALKEKHGVQFPARGMGPPGAG